MDGVGAGLAGCLDQLVHHQVRLGGGVAAQGVGLVREADVQGVAVGLGIHGDGGDAFIPGCPDDAYGDFTAVRDQDLREVCVHWACGLLRLN